MASGDTLLIFAAQHATPPASAYATLDSRNGHFVLDFDDGTDEAALFDAVLPAHYDGGGLTIDLHWAATTATSGDVVWTVAIERIAANDLDIDADSFATAGSATGTANGTSGKLTVTSVALTDGSAIDSLAAGEACRIKVSRDADNGSDDLSGDAELLRVVVRET